MTFPQSQLVDMYLSSTQLPLRSSQFFFRRSTRRRVRLCLLSPMIEFTYHSGVFRLEIVAKHDRYMYTSLTKDITLVGIQIEEMALVLPKWYDL